MATSIMVKIQTGQIRWMMFSIIFPIVMGTAVATLIYSGGILLELSGLQAMIAFYGLALAITIGMGFLKNKSEKNLRKVYLIKYNKGGEFSAKNIFSIRFIGLQPVSGFHGLDSYPSLLVIRQWGWGTIA